ncbi:hypothetical protein TD95_002285 [Thielaviopsis punctulata]|uniref:Ribosomal protein S15 n=1 Tax=Thielaviopsis punctulata TaxID=72032 RepID=A0A0F4ZKP2_9PEZI|nr:hypothetical protein TD95_002285 [Thielaviopsis punctulata]
MVLRLASATRLGSVSLALRPALRPTISTAPAILPTVQTATLMTKWEKKQLAKRDPYRWAQIQQRKDANVKRQAELAAIRAEEYGDPVMGKPSAFVESFDYAGQKTEVEPKVDENGEVIEEGRKLPTSEGLLAYGLTQQDVDEALAYAYEMSKPVFSENRETSDPQAEAQAQAAHEQGHQRATEAINRILKLENTNSVVRLHANIRRIVDTFGRHNTDKFLKPKPPSIHPNTIEMPERSGPDTGSSEVQIAILTAKIRALKQALDETPGNRDKHNKRNLRLLVHRRQKLLKYMERKERGSERWTYMLSTLGLTPATWKNQISL